jgi:hypothetical protein
MRRASIPGGAQIEQKGVDMEKIKQEPSNSSVQKRKKPYIKPSFRFERTFETMALACGKMAGNEGQCHMVLKRS